MPKWSCEKYIEVCEFIGSCDRCLEILRYIEPCFVSVVCQTHHSFYGSFSYFITNRSLCESSGLRFCNKRTKEKPCKERMSSQVNIDTALPRYYFFLHSPPHFFLCKTPSQEVKISAVGLYGRRVRHCRRGPPLFEFLFSQKEIIYILRYPTLLHMAYNELHFSRRSDLVPGKINILLYAF